MIRTVATLVLLAFGFAAPTAHAQSNVRAWSAEGQVFVIWQVDATAPLTYDIYRSATPLTAISQGTLSGRMFEPEWSGARLRIGAPNARWRIPGAKGGFYTLAANEGLFVFTPSAPSTEFFAVVRSGSTVVSATNRTASAVLVAYDPVNQPVTCHEQLSGVTQQGYPFRTYAMWAYGRDDPNDARPDTPVLANAAKHGAPHVFTVFEPEIGLPAGRYPATICLHGGGQQGSHWSWAPESIQFRNTGAIPIGGVTVAMDDRVFISTNGQVNTDRPSNWFGWWPGMSATANTSPPGSAVVVPYTLRRLLWTIHWLQTRSPYAIDPKRTSVMGNSMGGAGTLLLSRFRPDLFSAATAFVPQHYTPETGQRLFGTPAQNLATTEIGPTGSVLRVNDFFNPAVRLSPTQRDYCLTRIFRGRRDEAVEWGPLTVQLFNEMSAGRWGTHLYWDNRDHTASDWSTEDPTTPAADIGEWVSPVRTERADAPYQARFRTDQSYPGFFDDDQDAATAGRQPTLGNGSPDDGTPWGTWCGFLDWDTETIFDTPLGWSCTLFLVGRSSVSVDNYPGTSATTSLTLRKPRKLVPAAGATIGWTLRDDQTDAVLQSGSVTAEANGLLAVTGLVIPKDPQRVRLELFAPNAPRTGDFNGDGFLDGDDVARIAKTPADLDGDGLADEADVALLERYVNRVPCTGDISGDGTVGGDDIALLLSSWGFCPGACPADLNDNGVVNGADLAILLANWGGCP